MAKKIRLDIPAPCHENWDAMTVSEKGRFCGSCQKTVLDFSGLTDYEIAQFFKKPSNGSICGRFNIEQLHRDISIPAKRLPWLKYFFQIILPAFLGTAGAKAQGKISIKDSARNPVTIQSQQIIDDKLPDANKKPDNLIGKLLGYKVSEIIASQIYKGKVIDDSGSAIPGATVLIKGTNKGVATDDLGQFVLNELGAGERVLVASAVGYETAEFNLPSDRKAISITLKKYSQCDLRGVVVVTAGMVRTTRPGRKQKEFPVLNEPLMDTASKFFNVFPNPVPSGREMTIEWKDTGEGYYQLQLVSSSGQVIHQRELWIDKGAKWLTLQLPPISKGQYFLQVSNKNTGLSQAEKILVL